MVKCSVAIPIYNRKNSQLNQVALESALAQQIEDIEILVVDDCTTDGTWKNLQKYSDPRLKLLRNEKNIGLFANFNRCLDLSNGKYLKILCSDDTLTDGILAREIRIMEEHPEVALLSSRGKRITPEGRFLGMQADHFKPGLYNGREAVYAFLWFQAHYGYNPLNYPSGILFRREIASKAGCFDTTMKMSGDVDFYLRVLEYGDLAVADFVGCYIGIHDLQAGYVLKGNTAMMLEIQRITERYRALLEEKGAYEEIRRQLSAYALGLALSCRLSGMPGASLAHYKIANCIGVSFMAKLLAFCKIVALRGLLKTTGLRLVPANPHRSL